MRSGREDTQTRDSAGAGSEESTERDGKILGPKEMRGWSTRTHRDERHAYEETRWRSSNQLEVLRVEAWTLGRETAATEN